jgi:hypothetical protein
MFKKNVQNFFLQKILTRVEIFVRTTEESSDCLRRPCVQQCCSGVEVFNAETKRCDSPVIELVDILI